MTNRAQAHGSVNEQQRDAQLGHDRLPQDQVPERQQTHPAAALQRAGSRSPSALRAADVLALQSTVGNRAVQRVLAERARHHAGDPAATAVQRQPQSDGTQPNGAQPDEAQAGEPEGEAEEPLVTHEYVEKASGLSGHVSQLAGRGNSMKVDAIRIQWLVQQGLGKPVKNIEPAAVEAQDAIKSDASLVAELDVPNIQSYLSEG